MIECDQPLVELPLIHLVLESLDCVQVLPSDSRVRPEHTEQLLHLDGGSSSQSLPHHGHIAVGQLERRLGATTCHVTYEIMPLVIGQVHRSHRNHQLLVLALVDRGSLARDVALSSDGEWLVIFRWLVPLEILGRIARPLGSRRCW